MDCGHGLAANRRPLLISLIVAVLVGLPSVALAEGPSLESREYKLMLNPAKFAGPPQAIVKQLWNELTGLIEKRLGPKNNGEPRHRESFSLRQQRTVMFRDTEKVPAGPQRLLVSRSRPPERWAARTDAQIPHARHLPGGAIVDRCR